ncbi:MAG: ribosome-associated translation inhibitor RaiA [Phycisphaerales bacterium]
MRIDVIGKHLTITDAIRGHAEQKAVKLPKHYDMVQLITFRLEELPHKKGFTCEVVVDVEKHDDFVASSQHADLYTAIDHAVEKASRQLTDFKEQLKQGKRGATSAGGEAGL